MKPVFVMMFIASIVLTSAKAELEEIEKKFRRTYEVQIGQEYTAAIANLDDQYLAALDRAVQDATKGGRLEEAVALRAETERANLQQALPESDHQAHLVVAKLRSTYRAQLAKQRADRFEAAKPLIARFEAALAAEQQDLTTAGKLDEALAVKAYRESGVAEKLIGERQALSTNNGKRPPLNSSLALQKSEQELLEAMLNAGDSSLNRHPFFEDNARQWSTKNVISTITPDPTALIGDSSLVLRPDQPGYYRMRSGKFVAVAKGETIKAWLLHREPFQRGTKIEFVTELPNEKYGLDVNHKVTREPAKHTQIGEWILTEQSFLFSEADQCALGLAMFQSNLTINCFFFESLGRK